jgi:predicted nucleotidyltransferase
MRFKDFIKESIIDIPRQRYAPGVFDNADTNNPKLKKSVRDIILNQIDKFSEKYPVKKYSLIGSILTKKYRDDADLDMNILFDVPKEKQEEVRKELASSLRSINGKLVPGTKHPINYFVITDPELKKKNDAMADGVFDIDENEFVRRPTEDTFDSEKYEADFQAKVKEIDVVKGELARDIIDYEELKDLTADDVLNLQARVNSKLDEIEDSIEVLVDIGDDVVKQRQSAFNDDMSPEEIRQFGKKHKLPKNIIYKYLEKYHYLKFYKKCKDILEDGKVTDKEIDSLKEAITLDKVKIKATAWFKSLVTKIKMIATTQKRYEYAAKILQDVIDRKKRERAREGLPLRHDIGYYASAVADTFRDIDDKKLQTMVHEQVELLDEAAPKTIAFAFGRFNPPTIGHLKLMDKVKSASSDYKIYLSRSEDPKKNPLGAREKLDLMKRMFPQHARNIAINPSNNVLDILTKLYDTHHRVIMVAGSDRVREFDTLLNRYNNVKSRHGYYYFEDIKVVSAGDRDPDAEGAAGMSASKMRAAAAKGDLEAFKSGLPGSSKGNGERIMTQVRKGMKLAASYKIENYKPIDTVKGFEQEQVRDLYVRDMIFNINDKVDYIKEDIKGIVKRRGTNYIVIEDNNNNLHKAWIWDCLPIAADREIEVREYNTNIDYGFEAVSEIKEPEIKKKLTDSLKKKAFGALRKELNMKQDENESYEIGADYANHTKEMTPGQTPDAKAVDAKDKGPHKYSKFRLDNETNEVKEKDIKEWALSDAVLDKYKERYKELWREKLDEVVKRMMEKI